MANLNGSHLIFQNRDMKYGYVRVSTEDQNIDMQLKALQRVGCKKIFKDEGLSGATTKPDFRCLKEQEWASYAEDNPTERRFTWPGIHSDCGRPCAARSGDRVESAHGHVADEPTLVLWPCGSHNSRSVTTDEDLISKVLAAGHET
jgi:hypothetical protein